VHKGRLEAFSDGVLAIIITIMVLELKHPDGATLEALRALAPTLVGYAVSFTYIAIYWNNHHHMLQAATGVDGKIMWANSHLLFWLSLVPFTTSWIGENPHATWPVAIYGVNLFCSGLAYLLLQNAILAREGKDSGFARAIGSDWKGKASAIAYISAIGLAFVATWIAIGIYIAMALVWLIPDPRISKHLEAARSEPE
jgi:uncharacterized membrane protein